MELKLNPWALMLIIGSVQSLFLALVFFKSGVKKSIGALLFGILLLSFSILLLDHSARLSELYKSVPNILYSSDPFWFIIAPLIFLYLKVCLAKKLQWMDLLHLIPFIFFLYLFFPLMFAPQETKIKVLEAYIAGGSEHSMTVKFIILAMMIQMISYFIYSVFYLNKYERKFRQQFSDNDIAIITKLKHLVLFFLVYFSFEFSFSTFRNFMNIQNHFIENWSLVVWVLFILSVAYSIIRKPELIDAQINVKNIEGNTRIKKSDSDLKLKLISYMKENQPFLKNDLGLQELANSLNTSTHHLSFTINNELDTNFYEFINSFRIKAVEEELRNGKHKTFSIFGIAQSKGFKSKASFYKFFKQEFNMTPSAYIESLKIKCNF